MGDAKRAGASGAGPLWCLPTPAALPGQRNPQDPLPSPSWCQSPGDPQFAATSQLGKALRALPELLKLLLELWLLHGSWALSCCQALPSSAQPCVFGVSEHTPGCWCALAGRSLSLWLPLPWDMQAGDLLGLRVPELPLHPSVPGVIFCLTWDTPVHPWVTPTGESWPGVPSVQAGGVPKGPSPPPAPGDSHLPRFVPEELSCACL